MLPEVIYLLWRTNRFERFNTRADQLQSFFFQLVAAIGSNHCSLVWQIKLFLLANSVPSLAYKKWHTVNWNVFLFAVCQEQAVRNTYIKPIFELLYFYYEFFFLVVLVRQHTVFKLKEISRFSVGIFLGLVNFLPYLLNVCF